MEQLAKISGRLLEGPVWDSQKQVLYFVDIEDKKIYRYVPKSEIVKKLDLHSYVGCLVLETTGKLIAAMADGLYRIDFEQHMYQKVMDSPFNQGIRFNDGKCDRYGNLWVGTMAIDQSLNAKEAGSLYCIRNNLIIEAYTGYTIPNGLSWNQEGTRFYHIDTPTKKVDEYEVEEETVIKNRSTRIDLSNEQGSPDGMCQDEDGNFWIAMWGGSKVICCHGMTGKVLEEILVPDKNVSCCTFGGENLDTLYITTAKDNEGNGGRVYTQTMKVRGREVYRYGK